MSLATIRIPAPLRSLTDGRDEVVVEGADVRAALRALTAAHVELEPRLFDDQGALRAFVIVFLEDAPISSLSGLDSVVEEGAVISIIPAVAGGAG